MRVLGLQWNIATDQLSLTPKMIGTKNRSLTTKREVLKNAPRLLDPFGIASPVSIHTCRNSAYELL